ncbi:MAG: hypothetical protein FWD39_05535 [Clostridiales bacterium]|nr:hypothetical protein [Clostridiales bacterium]
MLRKIMQKSKYLFSDLFFMIVYGFILYYLTAWLAGYSLLFAYLGNLALMILILAIDELTLYKMMQPEKIALRMKKAKDPEKNFQALLRGLENSVSFKTDLYLFYIFILIASQIMDFNSALAGEGFNNFILTTRYSILLLLALDSLIRHFSKDRERMRKISEKLKETLTENQD